MTQLLNNLSNTINTNLIIPLVSGELEITENFIMHQADETINKLKGLTSVCP